MSSTDVSITAAVSIETASRARPEVNARLALHSSGEPGRRSNAGGSSSGANVAENVEQQVDQLNDAIQDIRRELHFTVDEGTGRTIIKVIDSATQEIVRQIPAEEVVALLEHLQYHDRSVLLNTRA